MLARSRGVLSNDRVRLRRGIAGGAECLSDGAIRVEIYLPVVRGVAVRPHGQYRAALGERQDFDVGRWARR